MTKKKWMKKGTAVVLSTAMVLGVLPGTGSVVKEVKAAGNEAPTSEYFTDVEGLEAFRLANATDTVGKINFGLNGKTDDKKAVQQWKIAGVDAGINGGKNNIILFADTPYQTVAFEDASETNKNYSTDWGCTYTENMTGKQVYPNHYGSSDLRTLLKEYIKEDNTSYFSASERKKINDTTIYTNDTNNKDAAYNNVNYSTTDKLYAAYGDYNDDQYVTVGTNVVSNLNGGVRIDISKWGSDCFWLRSPNYYGSGGALVACPDHDYGMDSINVSGDDISVVPALNLNLSSVIFASAATAASSTNTGYKANDEKTANTYNLRYTSDEQESAVINQRETEVKVTNADGKYLMVQNGAGVYAKAISGDTEQPILASGIQMGTTDTDKLTDFSNCKVWLESTNDDRIITAKMAVREINSVAVTDIAPVPGETLATTATCNVTGVKEITPTVTWTPVAESEDDKATYNTTYTASITLTAEDGYDFTSNVTAKVDGYTATSVTENDNKTLTITYTYRTGARTVSNAYYATVDDLKDCYNMSDGTIGKIKFGIDGDNDRLWAICGTDADGTLALLSTSEFTQAAYGSTSEYSKSNFVTGMDTYLGISYFSPKEIDKMSDVSVKTNEALDSDIHRIESITVSNKKLYLPDCINQYYYANGGGSTIYVGSGNDIAINVRKLTGDNGFQTNYFWLRSPHVKEYNGYVLIGISGNYVSYSEIAENRNSVVPALNLNLSDVSFASAAKAASSTNIGYMANDAEGMKANTFTLRYTSDEQESAVISTDGTKVTTANAKGKYLMVQNSTGVYTYEIDSANKVVNASDIQMCSNVDTDFNDCKVWLESTDANRITTAKMATPAIAISKVEIANITAPVVGKTLNTTVSCATTGVNSHAIAMTWTPSVDAETEIVKYNQSYIASITLSAEDGYEFTSRTTATVNGLKATNVVKNSDSTMTVNYVFETDAKTVSDAYYATVDDLKDCYNLSGGTFGKIKFGLDGDSDRLWAICGTDTDGTLVLLSTSEFTTENSRQAYGSTSEYSKSNFVTDINKYVNADNNSSTYLGTGYFSVGELNQMADVTVKTNEPFKEEDGSLSSRLITVSDKKLYLPNSFDPTTRGTKIYVGSNNNISIDMRTKLTWENGFKTLDSWLRSSYYNISNTALVVAPSNNINDTPVDSLNSILPACSLNLSDALFASAAKAASTTYNGYSAKDTMLANTFTLRYVSNGSESAVMNLSKTLVKVKDAKDKYLMVQNSTGVYAMPISTDAEQTIKASDIQMGDENTDKLSDFSDCKVWLESTNDRITTAKMVTLAENLTSINMVAITGIDTPEIGTDLDLTATCETEGVTSQAPGVTWKNGTDAVTGKADYNAAYTASVTLTPDKDWYAFPEDVTATVNGQNATSVTKNADGTVTVTYTFTSTAKLTGITAPTAITNVPSGTDKTASPSATPMTEEQATADVPKQKLGMKVTSSTNQVKISWIKVPGADGYYIYGAKCGNKPKKLKTIKKASTTTWTQKKLKKGKVYKYTIVAYKTTAKGRKKMFTSLQLHITTKGGKYTNAKKVMMTFSSVTLTQGKTKQIKASIIKQIKKKKLVNHASTYRYLISDKRIVKTTKNGKIKAVGKGTCYVYVYANNGVSKKIKVRVRGKG